MRQEITYRFILLLLSFLSLPAYSQDRKALDSLFKLLDDSRVDTVQLLVNRKIARHYRDFNATKALEYYGRVQTLAQKLNLPLEEAENDSRMAYCYSVKGNYEKAVENYLLSIKGYEKLNKKELIVNSYLSIISVYASMNDFNKAKEYIKRSEDLLKDISNKNLYSSFYSQSGSVYSQEGNQELALTFMKKSLSIDMEIKDTASVVVSLGNIGLAFKKYHRLDSALYYTRKAFEVSNAMGSDTYTLAMIHNNLGSIYCAKGKFDSAFFNFEKSIAFAKQVELPWVEMENYRNLGDMFKTRGDYKNFILYHDKYDRMKDSLFTNDTKNQIAQLETDYIVDKKNMELVKKDASIQQEKNNRNIFILIALGTLLSLAVALYFNKRLTQKKKEVEHQNALISQQKEELQNLNHVKDRLFSVISHDLRNPLNTLHSYLMLSDNASLTADKKLLFKNQTIQAVAQTSNLLDNLLTWASMQLKDTTPNLIRVNIKEIIGDIVDLVKPQASQKQIYIEQSIEEIAVVSDRDILSIAVRNILTNAIKFSHQSGFIAIRGKVEDGKYKLSIQDQGVGISEEQLEQITNANNTESFKGTSNESGSGLGLFIVKQLLQKLKIPLFIESELNKGSRFVLEIDIL